MKIPRRSSILQAVGLPILAGVVLVVTAGASQLQWRWENPLPQGNPLPVVRWVGDEFVAAGGNGTILTSPDGMTWTIRRESVGGSVVQDVTRGNGIYVAVGGFITSGTILRSTNGNQWTSNTFGANLVTVSFGAGKFVAGAFNQSVATTNTLVPLYWSSDGLAWNQVDEHFGPNTKINHVTYADGRFLAGGATGSGASTTPIILTSPDGVDWTQLTLPAGMLPVEIHHISAGDGHWLALWGARRYEFRGADGWLFSTNQGVSWTNQQQPALRREAAFGNGRFVYVSGLMPNSFVTPTTGYTTDGVNWQMNLAPFGYGPNAWSVAYGAGRFVAVGEAGIQYSSPDGTGWVKHSEGIVTGQFGYYGLTVGQGKLLAAAYIDGVAVREADQLWQQIAPFNVQTKSLLHQAGQFVMVGGYELSHADVAVSTNGVNWEVVLTTATPGYEFYDVTYGGPAGAELHVITGLKNQTGVILTSPNARDWTEQTQTGAPEFAQRLYAIAWGAGRFVAVGNGGTVITSTNGLFWTRLANLTRPTGAALNLRGVRFVNGRFLALGNFYAFQSADGLTWNRLDRVFTDTLQDTAYGDGTYVVVSDQGNIYQTPDLVTWTNAPLKSPGPLIKVLFHEDAFYAVGHGSVILSTAPPPNGTSQPALAILRQGDQIRLEWNAPGFILQSAPGLGSQWNDLSNAVSPFLITPQLPMEIFQLKQTGP